MCLASIEFTLDLSFHSVLVFVFKLQFRSGIKCILFSFVCFEK